VKPHVKLYLDYFGYDQSDWIGCEVCNKTAVDIHHINARGMGGTSKPDTIDNLQALCRECHTLFGDKTEYKSLLIDMHRNTLKLHEIRRKKVQRL
jgi:5-methylcytosine-specific restriction endonuclease McrA